jgi:NADH-ubiquinone oxidoreductase chain 5
MYFSIYCDFNRWNFYLLNDNSKVIIFGIRGLMLMSIFGGRLLRWLVFPSPYFIFLPKNIKYIILVVCLLGLIFGYYLSNWSFYIKRKIINRQFISYIRLIWFLPLISTFGLIFIPLMFGNKFIKIIDNGWSEDMGAQNLNFNLVKIRQFIYLIQNNNLKVYLIYFFLFVLLFFIIIIYYLNSLN